VKQFLVKLIRDLDKKIESKKFKIESLTISMKVDLKAKS
jgi:hypothetical protein